MTNVILRIVSYQLELLAWALSNARECTRAMGKHHIQGIPLFSSTYHVPTRMCTKGRFQEALEALDIPESYVPYLQRPIGMTTPDGVEREDWLQAIRAALPELRKSYSVVVKDDWDDANWLELLVEYYETGESTKKLDAFVYPMAKKKSGGGPKPVRVATAPLPIEESETKS